MKLVWVTDLHLDHSDDYHLDTFYNALKASKPEGVLITGDTAEGKTIVKYLKDMSEVVPGVPLYVVLGNHDYYGSSIADVRSQMQTPALEKNKVFWLPNCAPIPLSTNTCLVGVDGWADGEMGNYQVPRIIMSDWTEIKELRLAYLLGHHNLLRTLRELGKIEADLATLKLKQAAEEGYSNVIFACHIPPWVEATWHQNHHSDDNWLPWFSNIQLGKAIEAFAETHTHMNIHVYCGHTHGMGTSYIRPNVVAHTGIASYGSPLINSCINIK